MSTKMTNTGTMWHIQRWFILFFDSFCICLEGNGWIFFLASQHGAIKILASILGELSCCPPLFYILLVSSNSWKNYFCFLDAKCFIVFNSYSCWLVSLLFHAGQVVYSRFLVLFTAAVGSWWDWWGWINTVELWLCETRTGKNYRASWLP